MPPLACSRAPSRAAKADATSSKRAKGRLRMAPARERLDAECEDLAAVGAVTVETP